MVWDFLLIFFNICQTGSGRGNVQVMNMSTGKGYKVNGVMMS